MESTELSDRRVAHRIAGNLTLILPLVALLQVLFFFVSGQAGLGPLGVTAWAVAIGAFTVATIAAAIVSIRHAA